MTAALNNFWEVTYRENYRLHYVSLGQSTAPADCQPQESCAHDDGFEVKKSTVPADSQAREACTELAVDAGVRFCLEWIVSYHMGEPGRVVTDIRVLEYQSDCAVIAAISHSAYQTNEAFIFRKVDGTWKVADDWARAVGYYIDETHIVHNMFSEKYPPLPFSCGHVSSD